MIPAPRITVSGILLGVWDIYIKWYEYRNARNKEEYVKSECAGVFALCIKKNPPTSVLSTLEIRYDVVDMHDQQFATRVWYGDLQEREELANGRTNV
jgi:hypothetical protein